MTETTTLMNLIVALLTPMLLSVTGGDRAQAREAATQAVSAYAARNSAELLLVAQSIALGIAVLSSVSLSMAENIPINLILRLRNNAVSLHRAAERCRNALPQPDSADATPEPPLSASEHAEEQRAITGLAHSRQRVADYQASLAQPPAAPPPPPSSPAPQTEDESFRAAWSAAMADVAQEMQAEMQNLSPADRRMATQRINALNATIADLTPRPACK